MNRASKSLHGAQLRTMKSRDFLSIIPRTHHRVDFGVEYHLLFQAQSLDLSQ